MARTTLAIAAIFVVASRAACTGCERDAQRAPDASAPAPAPSTGVVTLASAVGAPLAPIAPPLSRRPSAPFAPASAVAMVDPARWVWKPYRGDQFTVLFPGEPRVVALPPEDDKIGYTEAKVDVPGGQVSFAAGYSEHTPEEVADPAAFLDGRVNAPRRGLTDVLHKRSVSLAGGHPGRVLILRRDISGTPLRVYSRLYLVGRRLYSLIVSTLAVGGIDEDVVKKFMDSFKLG